MMPAVFWLGMYQISQATHMATKVPAMRRMNWKIDCPAVGVMEIATMIMAQTRRCSMKKDCVSCKKATIPIDIVAQAARNPKDDSEERKNRAAVRIPSPNFSHAFFGGRCSGSFLLLYASPM